MSHAPCSHPPGFLFNTAAIDKTLKEQEVSLAEALGGQRVGILLMSLSGALRSKPEQDSEL